LEPWVRDYLNDRGLLGTTVLWFESERGVPKPPSQWREMSVASVTTHDLPPAAGYLNFEEVYLRHRLGLLSQTLEEELARAEEERRFWLDYVAQHASEDLIPDAPTAGILRSDFVEDETERQVLGLYHALADSPCRVLNVTLPDAVGDYRAQNQPGTIDQYPNWRVWLGGPDGQRVWLEDVLMSRRARRLAAVIRRQLSAAER
jgi:4-alpha-glucanotransferase